jgi:hypothetical protein
VKLAVHCCTVQLAVHCCTVQLAVHCCTVKLPVHFSAQWTFLLDFIQSFLATEPLRGSRYIPNIEAIVKVKVKIKVALEQTTKAQRGITVDV